mmetsp:Transcript_12814/g.47920  ORF Transcript_12814/g.47920 Transcript_12814/m.47920 type:complete len:222 (-) Transcript_12814:543-1208(-)
MMSWHGTFTRHMSPFSSFTSTESLCSTFDPVVSSAPTLSKHRSRVSWPHNSGYAVSRSRITALSKCRTFRVRNIGPVHAFATQCSSNGISLRYCSFATKDAKRGECFFKAPMNPALANRLSPPGSATRKTSLFSDAATVNSSVGSRNNSMFVSMYKPPKWYMISNFIRSPIMEKTFSPDSSWYFKARRIVLYVYGKFCCVMSSLRHNFSFHPAWCKSSWFR